MEEKWKRSYRVVVDGVVGELQKHKALPSNQPCPPISPAHFCVCAPGAALTPELQKRRHFAAHTVGPFVEEAGAWITGFM